ncbi:hypothetical protein DNI29_04295 [Hymenobacter sediminis]|uniref:hypothetical protein n=1 Tax=Hymenobacter sediminis TaxID=2218621 RepID=UPI000DA6D696|nr:hypothetical protein [Hymenobacter sediminis]RPD50023.1 hypothetical protein DNI29_04295 [Hymenobacter sediminis]
MNTYQRLAAERDARKAEYERLCQQKMEAFASYQQASHAAAVAFAQENKETEEYLNSSFFTGPEPRLLTQRLG